MQSKESISRDISVPSTPRFDGEVDVPSDSDLLVERKDSIFEIAGRSEGVEECSFLMVERMTSVLVFPSSNALRCGKR